MRWLLVAGGLLLSSAALAGHDGIRGDMELAIEDCKAPGVPDYVHWCMSMKGFDFTCKKLTDANVNNWRCWRFDPESTRD